MEENKFIDTVIDRTLISKLDKNQVTKKTEHVYLDESKLKTNDSVLLSYLKENRTKGGKVILQPLNLQQYEVREVDSKDIVIATVPWPDFSGLSFSLRC